VVGNMGTDTEFCRSAVQIEGQTRYLSRGGRTFDVLDLSKSRSDSRSRIRHPDMGTDTVSGMPIRNVERPTFNSQLSMG
jgi:hypothetical protein